ncbi:MAG: DUF1850 domain-containing protein [Negativicutes bacterium]|nr:DUF1850 domain-containing protein [Negativicutes bacterium]
MNENVKFKDRTPESAGFRSFLKYKTILLISFLLLSCLLWFYANQLVVSVIPDGGQKRINFATKIGDKWYIEFTHSVQKTPVQEYFIVRGVDDLLMRETRYQSLGVGLPFLPSDGKFQTTKDGYFILEMNREFKTVKLRTGLEACPKIYHSGILFPLYKLYEPGTLLEIKVEKRYKSWLLN